MGSKSSSVLMDEIQRLSNKRQQLYAAKWSRRNRKEYRGQIKDLDSQIASLWHEYRSALVAADRPKPAQVIDHDSYADYFEQAGVQRPISGHQVKVGRRWRSVDNADLVQALGRYTVDIPVELPDDPDQVPPLKEVLAKRGLTLHWEQRTGYSYGRLVSIAS